MHSWPLILFKSIQYIAERPLEFTSSTECTSAIIVNDTQAHVYAGSSSLYGKYTFYLRQRTAPANGESRQKDIL